MPMPKYSFYLVNCLVLLFISGCAMALDCETDNAALRAMDIGSVQVSMADGSQFSFEVKVANTNKTRAAGFQRVCPATIAKTPILFMFPFPLTPRFHMNNVVAPIDIAFIRVDGSIDSIQTMDTYVLGSKEKPLYSAGSDVIAALEGHDGFFAEKNIDTSAKITWSLPDEKAKSQ